MDCTDSHCTVLKSLQAKGLWMQINISNIASNLQKGVCIFMLGHVYASYRAWVMCILCTILHTNWQIFICDWLKIIKSIMLPFDDFEWIHLIVYASKFTLFKT